MAMQYIVTTSGGYPALLGSYTLPVPAPVPFPSPVLVLAPVPVFVSRFPSVSRLKTRFFKISFLNI
jgi:hypothetical protein